MRASFEASGLENLIKNIEKAGRNVDDAVAESLEAQADILLEAEQEVMRSHYRTGAAYRALKKSPIRKVGDEQSIDVGALDIRGEDKDGFHLIYFEYGDGQGNVPAIRWKRGSVEKCRAKMKRIQKEILQRKGVPVE